MLISWILTQWANPLVRKITIYVGIALLLLLCLRWYGNAQWEKGVAAGDERTQARMEKEYTVRWQKESKAIEAEKAKLKEGVARNETDRKLLAARAEELGRARQAIDAALQRVVATAEANTAAGYESAAHLSDATVDDAIRTLSRQLEAERQPSRPADPR